MNTMFGLFDDRLAAESAVRDLETRGFGREAISILVRNFDGGTPVDTDVEVVDHVSHTAAGARTGAALGGLGGILLGATTLLVPGVGPLLAAGTILGYGLVGAVGGAAAGGLVGAFVDAGAPREHAEVYAEGLRRGGTLVSVQVANEEQADIVRDVFNAHRVVDIDQRRDYYRRTGFTQYNPSAVPYTAAEAAREREAVRAAAVPPVATTQTVVTQPAAVTPVLDYHDAFRTHYTTTYVASGLPYEHYAPAYEYGYRLGSPGMHVATWHDWASVEPEARRLWEATNPGTWDAYRDAIRAGWERSPVRASGPRVI